MASQTPTKRQAAAQRAVATRKRNAARRSASATRSAARRTSSSAGQTTREAGRTGRGATRTAGRHLDAATARLGVIGRQAQRALLIQLGAAAETADRMRRTARTYGDGMRRTARTYTNLDLVRREFDRFERRGARALSRRPRAKLPGRTV